MTAHFLSMEEYKVRVIERAREKMLAMSAQEQREYIEGIRIVRQALAVSGIPGWTMFHTAGALHATSSTLASLKIVVDAGLIDPKLLPVVEQLIHEQEIIAVCLGDIGALR